VSVLLSLAMSRFINIVVPVQKFSSAKAEEKAAKATLRQYTRSLRANPRWQNKGGGRVEAKESFDNGLRIFPYRRRRRRS
jgi:hypothetical protein